MENIDRYVILKFGNTRVLLFTKHGTSFTMTKHLEGHLTFDYSNCEVIGTIVVRAGELEPAIDDFLRDSGTYKLLSSE